MIEKPELTQITVDYKDKSEIRTVLTRLCESENFVRCVPVLVLKGNRDIAYELIQSNKNTMGIGQKLRQEIALELFCFSVSQE